MDKNCTPHGTLSASYFRSYFTTSRAQYNLKEIPIHMHLGECYGTINILTDTLTREQRYIERLELKLRGIRGYAWYDVTGI